MKKQLWSLKKEVDNILPSPRRWQGSPDSGGGKVCPEGPCGHSDLGQPTPALHLLASSVLDAKNHGRVLSAQALERHGRMEQGPAEMDKSILLHSLRLSLVRYAFYSLRRRNERCCNDASTEKLQKRS